jgi:hypothetical protein
MVIDMDVDRDRKHADSNARNNKPWLANTPIYVYV